MPIASGPALGVVRPVLGQEQIAVQQTLEIAGNVPHVDRHDAVVDLAGVAAPLPFNAGGVSSLLGVARLVNGPDGLRVSMVPGDDPLGVVSHSLIVVGGVVEELLKVPRGYLGRQRDWLGALSGQVRQLASDVGPQVWARLATAKAVVELGHKMLQFLAHTIRIASMSISFQPRGLEELIDAASALAWA